MKPQRMLVKQYTGTIESYNELVTDLSLDRDEVQVSFIDEVGDFTNLFTGKFIIMPFSSKRSDVHGLSYKPGDVYHIRIEDTEFTPEDTEPLTSKKRPDRKFSR